jgi:hypothetical protein
VRKEKPKVWRLGEGPLRVWYDDDGTYSGACMSIPGTACPRCSELHSRYQRCQGCNVSMCSTCFAGTPGEPYHGLEGYCGAFCPDCRAARGPYGKIVWKLSRFIERTSDTFRNPMNTMEGRAEHLKKELLDLGPLPGMEKAREEALEAIRKLRNSISAVTIHARDAGNALLGASSGAERPGFDSKRSS